MSNPIDAITEPVKEEMERRMRNSFYVSLVIAFIGYNWRAVLYLCYLEEKWDVRDRVKWLQDYVYKDSGYFLPLVGFPILSALAVTVLVPLVTDLLEDVTVWSKMWQNNRHRDIERRKREVAKQMLDLKNSNKELEEELTKERLAFLKAMTIIIRYAPQQKMNLEAIMKKKPVHIGSDGGVLFELGIAEDKEGKSVYIQTHRGDGITHWLAQQGIING